MNAIWPVRTRTRDGLELGTAYWLETRAAVIDLAEGGCWRSLTPPRPQSGDRVYWLIRHPNRGEPACRFVASAARTQSAWSNFTNLESTACDQSGIGNCSADDSSLGISAYYEFGNLWPGRPFFAGVGGGFKSVSVTQSYPTQGSSTVDLDIWQIDVYGGWLFPFAKQFEAFPMLGVQLDVQQRGCRYRFLQIGVRQQVGERTSHAARSRPRLGADGASQSARHDPISGRRL